MDKNRIEIMEEYLRITNLNIKELKKSINKFKKNKKKTYELSNYYGSNDWYTDRENFDNSIKAGVLGEDIPYDNIACIGGPSHAEEVGIGVPTAVSVSSRDPRTARSISDLFSTPTSRIYTNDDMLGMELAGSVKNVMALGSGIIDGMGFGDNTRAAMMTRGIAEMTRLGMALGAKFETFAGLSGVGDMIVTCTSMHSRNFRCGRLIGQGMDPEEARKSIGMVVEGMFTAEAAYELSKKAGVEMPITEAIYNVIQGNIKVEDALETLMGRPRKQEYK